MKRSNELEKANARIAELEERVAALSNHKPMDATLLTVNKTVASLITLSKQIVLAAEKMQALHERASTLNSLLTDIEEVAERTMVLSFNASIEAGRAGVEGRGFSVVANEVRKLADQTRRTAEETRDATFAINEHSSQVFALLSQAAATSRTQAVSAQGDAIKLMAQVRELDRHAA